MANEGMKDVAAASAEYLYTLLPGIVASDPPEAYRRLALHLEAFLLAWEESKRGFGAKLPEPSLN